MDITICLQHECPVKDTCYRYQAKPSAWQSFAEFSYDENGCEYYIDIEEIE